MSEKFMQAIYGLRCPVWLPSVLFRYLFCISLHYTMTASGCKRLWARLNFMQFRWYRFYGGPNLLKIRDSLNRIVVEPRKL